MERKHWSRALAGCLGAGLALSLAACGDSAAKELTHTWVYIEGDQVGLLPLADYEPTEDDDAYIVGISLLKDGTAALAMQLSGWDNSIVSESGSAWSWQTDGQTLTITDEAGEPIPLAGAVGSEDSPNVLGGPYRIEGQVLMIELEDGSTLELRKPSD
jgi:hypothetical protein